MKQAHESRIAFCVFPFDSPSIFAISNKMISVLCNVYEKVYFICGNIPASAYEKNVQVVDIKTTLHVVKNFSPKILSALLWILKFFYTQIRMSFEIIRRNRDIDVVYCYLGNYFQLPLLIARMLGKKTIIGAAGIDNQIASVAYQNRLIPAILEYMMKISYWLAHQITIQSWLLANNKVIGRWRNKLAYQTTWFGGENTFCQNTDIRERKQIVGYVGRISNEKGIIEFIQSLPLILSACPEIEILIVGSGMIDTEVESLLNASGLEKRVKWLKWINNSDLPSLYNQMRLIVIPSKSEGLPNVLLEAISCGTPVLATAVGGIPDIIIDHQTGFILPSLEKEKIAEKVLTILDNEDLQISVAQNAKHLILDNFSFEAAVRNYKINFLALSKVMR